MKMKRLFLMILIFSKLAILNVASESFLLEYKGSGNYTLVERTNLRRYDNGKYTGLLSREVRSFVSKSFSKNNDDDIFYEGSFYVTEQTVKSQKIADKGIHDSVLSSFFIKKDGSMSMNVDNGFPSFRGFPSFPKESVSPGSVWSAKAIRAFDPLNKGVVTRMPIYVQYELKGYEQYKGEDVFRLSALWATRYGKTYVDYNGDADLISASGSHKADILVSVKTGNAILIRDNVDEVFNYKNGESIALKGTIILFTEYPPAYPKNEVFGALQRVAALGETADDDASSASDAPSAKDATVVAVTVAPTAEDATSAPSTSSAPDARIAQSVSVAPSEKITYMQTPSGLRLTLEDIQFAPDKAELLQGESERLDKIASVLQKASLSQFLVNGHTADVGKPEEEQSLSEKRSRVVAEELVKRGLDADRFICRGSGAKNPIDTNATPNGRARNRRVEITILE